VGAVTQPSEDSGLPPFLRLRRTRRKEPDKEGLPLFLQPKAQPHPQTSGTATAEPGSATAYARKAFTDELAILASTPEGRRNDQLNRSAFNLFQLVGGGHLDYDATWHALYGTASGTGLPSGEVTATLRSAARAGLASPRRPSQYAQVGASLDSPLQALDEQEAEGVEGPQRELTLTAASSIQVRPVHWLWEGRIALGTLALLGGREGLGKSTIAYWLVAEVTRGRLPGAHFGQPRAVIIAATEDSWAHTIVPRLMAADADLDRVFRVDVTTVAGVHTTLSLPRDLAAMKRGIEEVDAAVILLDPLVSRLDSKLDSHKDAEVRLALEPLTELADACSVAMFGIIHVNKSTQADPLNLLMGSRAFVAVARAVLFAMDPHEDDQNLRLLGQPKNNLGRTDLPTLTFTVGGKQVADTDEGPVTASHIIWNGERQQSITEALEAAGQDRESRSATAEAADWLVDHLTSQGGCDDRATICREGTKAGHKEDALKRAFRRLRLEYESVGFPRTTVWILPGTAAQSGQIRGESALTALTAPTGGQSVQSVQSVQSGEPPRANAPTENDQPSRTTEHQGEATWG
jgi:hypothetical protein